MKTFKNILWVTRGKNENKQVAKWVLAVTKNFNSRLKLFNVVEELPSELAFLPGYHPKKAAQERKNLQNLEAKNSTAVLKNAAEKIKTNGINVSSKVAKGKEIIEIIHQAHRFKHDLVIKKVGGDEGTTKWSFGNEDIQIIRNCPCPVLLLKPRVEEERRVLLVAVDPDPMNPERDALNSLILDYTLPLAKCFKKTEVHIVHVWDMHGGGRLIPGGSVFPGSKKNTMLYRERLRRRQLVHGLLDQYDWSEIKTQLHILKGNPRQVIPRLAKKLDAGVVVMGTLCRTGISGLIIGNTAETVFRQLKCSVLAVKPTRFIPQVALEQ